MSADYPAGLAQEASLQSARGISRLSARQATDPSRGLDYQGKSRMGVYSAGCRPYNSASLLTADPALSRTLFNS
jgi:hypothetical protein